MDQFDQIKAFFDNTEPVCEPGIFNQCAFQCPDGQTWYNATENLQHNGVYICDMYDSRDWESYQIDNVTFQCQELDTACGNLAASFDLEEGVSYECNGVDSCSLSCSNGLFPFPNSQVLCDNDKGWNQTIPTISCTETPCGNTADFDFGSRWRSVRATCEYSDIDARSTCNLDCPNGGQPSHDVVTCNATGTVPAQGVDIFCPNGLMILTVGINCLF